MAEKIRHHLSEPDVLGAKRVQTGPGSVQHSCSASMGVCLFGYQDSSARDADLAMYQAKASGGKQVHCLGVAT